VRKEISEFTELNINKIKVKLTKCLLYDIVLNVDIPVEISAIST